MQRDRIVSIRLSGCALTSSNSEPAGGFFQRLEEGVGRLDLEPVGLADDAHLTPAGGGGAQAKSTFEVADLFDDDAAGFGFRLDDVHVRVRQDGGDGRTDDQRGELRGEIDSGLRAHEQIGVPEPPADVGAAQVIKRDGRGKGHGNGW